MKAEHAAALLEADAILPVKQKAKTRSEIDTLSARVYQHPALTGPVVRLTADSLAQGEDLAMEFLGFASPKVTGPIGQRQRRALGFPGWALIHDPDHAKYALEVVKEFRREARRAKSKPGHGFDGITAIAKKLNRSVAHFLPSFWEEAGRVFIDFGNSTYASRCFGKAREAEKVHALKVDENIRRAAFLEFALAGCLTIKALTEYSKELQNEYGAEQAWEIFRELIVRRTLGGMPPWAAMAKDVKRICKAAKLDFEEQLQGLLREIIDSPAMARADTSFWTNCGDAPKTLAHAEPDVGKALLSMTPETSYWDNSALWEWLELLEQWELLPVVYGEGNKAMLPEGTAADWLASYCQPSRDGCVDHRVHQLLPKMAKRLKKEKQPLKIYGKRWREFTCDVDLIDLALELGVELVDPPGELHLQLDEWANVLNEDEPPENRPRDPIYLAGDERFAPALQRAVGQYAGNSAFEAAAEGKQALAEARRQWLTELVSAPSQAAMPKAWTAVEALKSSTSRRTFREFPEAYELLKKADVAVALHNTLTNGLIDEYGWPALEEAIESLRGDAKKRSDLNLRGAFPYIIVSNGLNVIVVGRDGPVLECELNLKKTHEIRTLDYYDGDLLVSVTDTNSYGVQSFWASNPKKMFEGTWRYGDNQPHGAVVERSEGGWFNGKQTVSQGDTKQIHDGDHFYHDGEHFWQVHWENGYTEQVLREVDPANGKVGRRSMPAFLEDFITDKAKIDLRTSTLLKVGDVANDSPLGGKDGLIGWRIRETERTWQRAEGIDGRFVEAPLNENRTDDRPVGMLDQPGTDQKLIITGDNGWGSPYRVSIQLWSPDGSLQIAQLGDHGGAYQRGQEQMLLPLFWHLFQVRDIKASKKLRKLKLKDAEALIKAAQADLEKLLEQSKEGESGAYEKLDAAVEKLLPQCHPRLAMGVRSLAVSAARCRTELEELWESRDPSVEEDESFSGEEVQAFLQDALRELNVGYSWGDVDNLMKSIDETAAVFAGEKSVDKQPSNPGFMWNGLLDRLDTKLWQRYWSHEKLFEDHEKLSEAAWVQFMRFWRQTRVAQLPGKFRYMTVNVKKSAQLDVPDGDSDEYDFCRVLQHKDSRYLFYCEDREEVYEDPSELLEYTESAKFATPTGFTIISERELETGWTPDQIETFLSLIPEREPPFPDDEKLQRLADAVGVSKAEAGLVWCGYPNFDDWSKNYLPKSLRERLGLKVAEAEAARQSLKGLDYEVRTDILGALLDGDPADFWENQDAVIDRLIAAWGNVVPDRLDLPSDVMDAISTNLGWGIDVGTVCTAFAAPEDAEILCEGVSTLTDSGYSGEIKTDPETCFNSEALQTVVATVPALFHMLPVGDPARKAAADVYDLAIKRLKSPDLMLEIGSVHLDESLDFLKQFGKTKKSGKQSQLENGPLVGLASEFGAYFAFRPAKATTAKALEQLKGVIAQVSEKMEYEMVGDAFDHMLVLRSDGFKEMAKRIRKTPLDEGQFEANPMHSATDLVAEAAKKLKLSEEAAAFYLQTLALHDCTTKKVREWNDWTAAQYNKAAKELVAAELVLEAKRARAGRKHFLPGGWEALKSPNLPLETWKLPLYQIIKADKGQADYPLERIILLKPCHELFAEAWQRVTKGDKPQYEEV